MRFLENIDLNVSADFMPRRYLTPAVRVIPFYLISLILVIGTLQFQEWFGATTTSLIAFGLLSVIAGIMFMQLQESNDLTMASDFQNLLFAGAASLGSSFCFFVRRDGTIVYANDATRSIFPHFMHEHTLSLDTMLTHEQVSPEDITRLYSALTRGKKETLIFTITSGGNEAREFILMVEPIERPAGYYVVHGRPYTMSRQETARLTGSLSGTKPEKLEHLLNTLTQGLYLTGETGMIEYANPALEQLLGYESHYVQSESVPVQQVIYHADGIEPGEFSLQDFSGQVMVKGSHQRLLTAYLDQRRITDAGGKLLGVLGILTPMGE